MRQGEEKYCQPNLTKDEDSISLPQIPVSFPDGVALIRHAAHFQYCWSLSRLRFIIQTDWEPAEVIRASLSEYSGII